MTLEPPDLAAAQLSLVKMALTSGAALPTRLDRVRKRNHLAEATPAGFLAQFNARSAPTALPGGPPRGNPEADVDTVLMLQRGVNRVGYDPMFGDFEKPARHAIESRQWLLFLVGDRAYVAEDHSTNQSLVLPQTLSRLDVDDPRYVAGCTGFGAPRDGMVALDWAGSTMVELAEGDVLITCSAAFVFGRLGAPVESLANAGHSERVRR